MDPFAKCFFTEFAGATSKTGACHQRPDFDHYRFLPFCGHHWYRRMWSAEGASSGNPRGDSVRLQWRPVQIGNRQLVDGGWYQSE